MPPLAGGCKSQAHPREFILFFLIVNGILFVDEKVYEITGEKTKFFRPPFIDVSHSMYDAIEQPFICGIDPRDYMENISAQERADFILRTCSVSFKNNANKS